MLDIAKIPTKKTFPPRTLICAGGTFLGLTLAITGIIVTAGWKRVEAGDLRKEFAMELLTDVRASLPNFSRNHANGNSNGHRSQGWGRSTDGSTDADDKDCKT